jgi:fructokinase
MNQPDILCLGEVLWDLFPTGPRFGGAPANLACHATLLGGKVALVSAVGDDPRGREALTILRAYGVDVSLVQTKAGVPTGSVSVTLDAAGKPTFEIQPDAAWDHITLIPDLTNQIAEAKILCFGTLGQRSKTSRATLRHVLGVAEQKGVRRVLDVNLRKPFHDASLIRDSISLASVLKFSEDELEEIKSACGISSSPDAEAILAALLERFDLELVVMTRGADGALLVSWKETVRQPGVPTTVRDTVGAGDAFTAAMVVGLLKSDSLKEIARVACKTASLVCAHSGAVPDLSQSPTIC